MLVTPVPLTVDVLKSHRICPCAQNDKENQCILHAFSCARRRVWMMTTSIPMWMSGRFDRLVFFLGARRLKCGVDFYVSRGSISISTNADTERDWQRGMETIFWFSS